MVHGAFHADLAVELHRLAILALLLVYLDEVPG